MKNELATREAFELAPVDAELAATLQEEMQGLGTISFDTVKIPSGGGLAFEIAGDDPDNPDVVKELVGVIVAHVPTNVYFASEYDGANDLPDCASADGVYGYDRETGEVCKCADCPRNRFGSGKNGGKACQNRHELYILRSGEPLPIKLTLPATSLKNFKEYLFKRVLMRGKKPCEVITKVTLKKCQNSGGISYSQAVFALADVLTPQQSAQVQGAAELVKSVLAARKEAPMMTEIADEDSPFDAE